MLELPNKSEKIQQLAWEPRGSRFALLHGEGNRPTGEGPEPGRSGRLLSALLAQAHALSCCTARATAPRVRALALGLLHGGPWDAQPYAAMVHVVANSSTPPDHTSFPSPRAVSIYNKDQPEHVLANLNHTFLPPHAQCPSTT